MPRRVQLGTANRRQLEMALPGCPSAADRSPSPVLSLTHFGVHCHPIAVGAVRQRTARGGPLSAVRPAGRGYTQSADLRRWWAWSIYGRALARSQSAYSLATSREYYIAHPNLWRWKGSCRTFGALTPNLELRRLPTEILGTSPREPTANAECNNALGG